MDLNYNNEERRDLYDKERRPIGKTIGKGDEIPEGTYILVVLVFIQNDEGKFLIQKRSAIKNGKYATTGGHPVAGQTSKQGIIQEVKEELGLEMVPEKVQWYYGGRLDDERVFWDDFYYKVDNIDLTSLKLQKEEVESVCWLSADEIMELKEKGEFFLNHFEEYEALIDWLKKEKV